MKLQDIRQLLTADLQATDDTIRRSLHSEIVLINQVANYIINSGGKRIRPLLVLLSAKAFGYQEQQHIDLAAIIEFIHTATLLHDDVVDESDMRRGNETANAIWGNQASVLVGDFLYSRAFQMMVKLKNLRIMDILANTTNVIAEGEVLQLMNCNDPDTTEQRYMDVIHFKTAQLFEAAAELGALVATDNEAHIKAMAAYGRHLGAAFQLIDDVLDYSASEAEMGKNIGDDLAEGKPTLPLIHAMKVGTPEQVELIRTTIEQGTLDHLDEIQMIISNTNALDYTREQAQVEADKAIEAIRDIPASDFKTALEHLTKLAINRSH